jgi:membrane protein implicated in regulation of membrane protease activity
MVVPIEDLIFVVCTLVGGGLLLITVLVDDILGGVLDALHVGFDIGGVSLMPLLLGFVSMFGVGGLPFSTSTLVGKVASVSVSIPAGRFGSVLVKAEGQTHEFSATSAVDITAGTAVTVTGTAGTGLLVAPLAQSSQPSTTTPGGTTGA